MMIESTDNQSELWTQVYEELRIIARRLMGRVPLTDTLQPTALVNQAYLRIHYRYKFINHKQLIGLCARAMQDIVVEQARRHAALKRGAGRRRQSLRDVNLVVKKALPLADVYDIAEALEKLDGMCAEAAALVRSRFYGGLTSPEAAQLLGVSETRAKGLWAYAKSVLYKELTK